MIPLQRDFRDPWQTDTSWPTARRRRRAGTIFSRLFVIERNGERDAVAAATQRSNNVQIESVFATLGAGP